MPRIDVLIADDHAIVREGLSLVLENEADIRVSGQARNGDEAVSMARHLAPEVVLLDLQMPGLGGAPAVSLLRTICPASKVLALSMHEDARYVRAAMAAGAHGYVAKRSGAPTLLRAIRAVAAGERFLDPALPLQQPPPGAEPSLSTREREVAGMVAQGLTNRQVALALGISKSSVETYRARVFDKLGVTTRAELIERVHGGGS
jgi:DNA-binding NarL/FixJ family response regulator